MSGRSGPVPLSAFRLRDEVSRVPPGSFDVGRLRLPMPLHWRTSLSATNPARSGRSPWRCCIGLAPGRLSSLGRSGAGRCSRGQRSAGRRECCRLRPDSALSSGCGTVRGSRASGNPSLATPYDAANPVPGTVSRSVSDGAIDAFPGQVGVAVMPRALLDHVLIHPPQRGRPALSGLIVGNPVRHLDHIVQVTLGRCCPCALHAAPVVGEVPLSGQAPPATRARCQAASMV